MPCSAEKNTIRNSAPGMNTAMHTTMPAPAHASRPVTATSVTQPQNAAMPSVTPPTMLSPHVSLNTETERLNESPIDRSSSTSTGTTKNVASDHAAPMTATTM